MNLTILNKLYAKNLYTRCRGHLPREGKMLVIMAILLPSLLGVAGLVLDGGLMMSEHRNLQHTVDAAATAAAMDLRLGKEPADAVATATDLIQNGNAVADAVVTVNIPPSGGPFAGRSTHVEVLAARQFSSHLSQVVDGIVNHEIEARAVAGVEAVTSGAAIIVLDPDPADLTVSGVEDLLLGIDIGDLVEEAVTQTGVTEAVAEVPVVGPTAAGLLDSALVDSLTDLVGDLWADAIGEVTIAPTPTLTAGLEIEGLGQLMVDGAVLVNNQWGGVDENGETVGEAPAPPYAVACMPLLPLTQMAARDIRVVGGVDSQDNYGAFEGGASPLQANRLPVPDPFLSLPVPSLASDAANVSTTVHAPADAVRVALPSDEATQVLNDVLAALSPLLQPLFQPLMDSQLEDLTTPVLQPGVYNSITVLAPLGGARFEPGVYIIRGTSVVTNMSLCIVGPVHAEGVLFYITDSSGFDASTGLPDTGDDVNAEPSNTLISSPPSAVILPLLSGARLTGLNDPGSPFDGMLLYQRRLDRRPIIVEAQQLLGSGDISGTVYSKWGHVMFLGGFGSYDLRFVIGTMRVLTVTDTTLAPTILLPPARDVLLLE